MPWVHKNKPVHTCRTPWPWPWRRDWVWQCGICEITYRLEDTGWYASDLEWIRQ